MLQNLSLENFNSSRSANSEQVIKRRFGTIQLKNVPGIIWKGLIVSQSKI
jgi:hypothetical protein